MRLLPNDIESHVWNDECRLPFILNRSPAAVLVTDIQLLTETLSHLTPASGDMKPREGLRHTIFHCEHEIVKLPLSLSTWKGDLKHACDLRESKKGLKKYLMQYPPLFASRNMRMGYFDFLKLTRLRRYESCWDDSYSGLRGSPGDKWVGSVMVTVTGFLEKHEIEPSPYTLTLLPPTFICLCLGWGEAK
jgi:hypothetical protein